MNSEFICSVLNPHPHFLGVFRKSQFEKPKIGDFLAILFEDNHWVFVGRANGIDLSSDSNLYQTQSPTCGLFAVASVLYAPKSLPLSPVNRLENERLVMDVLEQWIQKLLN